MTEPVKFNKKNPCPARLKRAAVLTGAGSEKDTRHYELDLGDSGMAFEPGDSLAVQPENDPEVVDTLLEHLGFSGREIVGTKPDGSDLEIRDAFLRDCSVTEPSTKFLKALAERTGGDSSLSRLLASEDRGALKQYLWGLQVIDLLEANPGAEFTPEELTGLLGRLNVRLYSIASSLKAHPGEVHLTVATVRYTSHGRRRGGVCSTWLAERIGSETVIPTFITPGKGFRLPSPEDATPIIMCGPGTGIAPFRAFVQERRATNAAGKAWLFFGEQHQASDFFYEDEWRAALDDGVLARMDTAFSRDQEHKVYVQHRMLEQAAEFWKWLQEGAIFYVCGDASRMAVDVDEALRRIVQEQGCMSRHQADEYVEAMKQAKRYRRDVY